MSDGSWEIPTLAQHENRGQGVTSCPLSDPYGERHKVGRERISPYPQVQGERPFFSTFSTSVAT